MQTFEKIELVNQGIILKGRAYVPDRKIRGVLIFTHGLGYCDRQYKIDGKFFAENDFVMITYNLRGHAGTAGEWTLNSAVEDLNALIGFATQKYSSDQVGVMGHSTGALIALLAALKDTRVKFGSIVNVVTSLTESYLYWFKSGFNEEVKEYFKSKGQIPAIIEQFLNDKCMLEKFRLGMISHNELDISHRYGMLKSKSFESFFNEISTSINILTLADRLLIPLLIIRGHKDQVMDPFKTDEFYDKVKNIIATKKFVTDSDDHFQNDNWPLIQSETLKFFNKQSAMKSFVNAKYY